MSFLLSTVSRVGASAECAGKMVNCLRRGHNNKTRLLLSKCNDKIINLVSLVTNGTIGSRYSF